jgi:hypothetical protein
VTDPLPGPFVPAAEAWPRPLDPSIVQAVTWIVDGYDPHSVDDWLRQQIGIPPPAPRDPISLLSLPTRKADEAAATHDPAVLEELALLLAKRRGVDDKGPCPGTPEAWDSVTNELDTLLQLYGFTPNEDRQVWRPGVDQAAAFVALASGLPSIRDRMASAAAR